MKPIRGLDRDAYENFASFCRQQYPTYQVIFGAESEREPAAAVAQQIRRDFPDVDIQVVIGASVSAANPKVGNLAGILPFAKHSLLLISDSDIRVEPTHLRRFVHSMADPRVGVVTCLYRSSARGFAGAVSATARAMAEGEITPEEAMTAAGIFELQRRAVETADLERRLARLEDEARQRTLVTVYVGDDPDAYDDPAFYSPWPMFHSSGRTGLVFVACLGLAVVISLLQTRRELALKVEIKQIDYSTSAAFNVAALTITAILIGIYWKWW